MPRVGIDCRFASARAGLGTYTRSIVEGLLTREDCMEYVLFVHSDPVSRSWVASLPGGKFSSAPLTSGHYSLSEQWELPRAIRNAGIDVYFAPHFNVPFLCPVPFVATIHDLILHTYAEGSWIKKFCYARIMSSTLRRSLALIAVSRFTKCEIGRIYGASVFSKVSVIAEGVSSEFRVLSAEEKASRLGTLGFKPGFLLYVGNAKPHKNLRMLIEAHRQAKNAPALLLVTDPSAQKLLHFEDRVKVVSHIDDGQLCALYGAARCFVTASLYEGFCLPVLEARACGCPVIAFNTSAIPEIAGDHAALVPPSVASLKEAIEHPPTVSDPPESIFQWSTACASTAAILHDALPL